MIGNLPQLLDDGKVPGADTLALAAADIRAVSSA